MIWSQRIDPKAGEWKHEIMVRGLLGLASAGLSFLFFWFVYLFFLSSMSEKIWGLRVIDLVLFCAIGLIVGLLETGLRRIWRYAPINCVLCVTGFVLGSIVSDKLGSSEDLVTWAPMIALGAAYGICAGLGAQNLLATILCCLGGQIGALLGYECFQLIEKSDADFAARFALFLLFVFMLLPSSLCIGVGVWAGCKFSKTKSSESPQPPAPSEL